MSKLSFSLNKPKTTVPAAAPSFKQPTAFSAFDDDEPVDAAPTASSSKESVSANKKLLAQNVLTSKKLKKQMEEEKKVDSTVYEYDEVWDKMQMAKLQQKETKEAESKRKPKYIHDLLSSAATRKLDHLRAEEKMMQRERELEGDEFADKESFVTQAYQDQMEEVRKAEEEEKKRDELKKKQGTSTGLAQFYRKLLEDSEQSHEATVAATQKPIIGPQGPLPNMTITKPPDFAPLSDLERARIAREEGKEVELNDDNQIIDKRDLLSGGLNLSGTNTRTLKMLSAAGPGPIWTTREINERRHREIERQMEEEQERVRKEREREEHEKTQRIIAKRNTEEDVESARTRFLERKRRKLEEAHDAGE
ncbi:coiled-coil domain-containing protein 55-domain containing protein [Lentinula guzmanii]|uniref:Coiled-coil domain-containing protein 55-domain containing protein n=1 Tax=Lentinula guzmanii TaxID=2804957 RepID=A0AA38J8S6_9AGAR|nr:coiled-coil domain-containing protein 55-domain containing protein [Lentinula guzmanii]KAJ3716759.1 coiled-coil domain-containing protein 55-domain containing protein [Lentinula guzmanii]